ncbi:Sec-independent protein translocase protein TatB [Rhizobiaceae bacterium]|nr:Sec-independent protein translocase protein TatB [Rhizobiaceae bacterium]
MFDIGGTELMVVAIVAILFVGPRELPGMLRTFGQMVRKVRGLAGDFQRQFDDALKDAELDGLKKNIDDVRNLDPTKAIKDKLNPLKSEMTKTAGDIEAGLAQPARKVETDEGGMPVFDEANSPKAAAPVKVDVEAALERQRELDAAAQAKPKPAKRRSPAKAKAPAAKTAKPAPPKAGASKPKAAGRKPKAAASSKKPATRKTSA